MSLDDRRKGQEGKFAHDAELRFRAEARRNRTCRVTSHQRQHHKQKAPEMIRMRPAQNQSEIKQDIECSTFRAAHALRAA